MDNHLRYHWACSRGYIHVVEVLLEVGQSCGITRYIFGFFFFGGQLQLQLQLQLLTVRRGVGLSIRMGVYI